MYANAAPVLLKSKMPNEKPLSGLVKVPWGKR